MSTPARSTLTTTRHSDKPERYWLLTSADGVLAFCIRATVESLMDVEIDGVPYVSWGIDAHIPLERCANPWHTGEREHCGADYCGLLPGVPCCLSESQSEVGHDLLRRWIAAGQDDDVIWAELERRFPEMVTANVTDGGLAPELAVAAANRMLLAAARRLEKAYDGIDRDRPRAAAGRADARAQLALAARELVDAINALPCDRQPAGWARSSCDGCGAWMPALPPDAEPRIQNCAACVARFRAAYPDIDEGPFR